jgi:hypothetical protein
VSYTVLAKCVTCGAIIARADRAPERMSRPDFPRPFAKCPHSETREKIVVELEWIPKWEPNVKTNPH